MQTVQRDRLAAAVQANCHIADARGAADLTLCIYLLQMREYYRWEQGIAALAPLPREAVAGWLTAREALWEAVAETDYAPLALGGRRFAPFDAEPINALLAPEGLVYGAGEVAPGRASFFLAELERVERRGKLEIRHCGRELARSLAAPPAALQGGIVVLRRAALRRWLYEKYEAWSARRAPGPFGAALAARGHDRIGAAAVEAMVEHDAETLLLHEQGEVEAARRLGPDWQALRAALPSRRAELFVRATRDHLADCLVTLPALLRTGEPGAIHLWFANLEGIREQLFPRLAPAYAAWCAGDGGAALGCAAEAGAAHWGRACLHLLALHRGRGAQAPEQIERLVTAPQWALR